MASTTTNYGFDVPTSSDLVKNGATQIALLGQDLDTFLFRPFSKNGVLNSNFSVFQRGTSIAVGAARSYTADQWNAWRGGLVAGMTVSQQLTNDTTNLPFIKYCARAQRDSGNTSTQPLRLAQDFESINSNQYAGKSVTVSFYARKGANYSVAASDLRVEVLSGTGTDQTIVNGYTGQATVCDVYNTITTTWQRFTVTGTASTGLNQIGVVFTTGAPVGTAGAADYFEVTGVQLEVGNQASPYTPATPTYATELAACQRYYQRFTGSSSGGTFIFQGAAASTTQAVFAIVFPTQMRITPTVLDVNNLAFYNFRTGALFSGGTFVQFAAFPSMAELRYTNGTVMALAGDIYQISSLASASTYIGFSAEI
jgi:hypothetical protein